MNETALVSYVEFSPDGTRLASAVIPGTVPLWDTVPYRIRQQERQAILGAQTDAQQVIDELRQKYGDWTTVVERIRTDSSLTKPFRRAALNEVLRRAIAPNEPTVTYSSAP